MFTEGRAHLPTYQGSGFRLGYSWQWGRFRTTQTKQHSFTPARAVPSQQDLEIDDNITQHSRTSREAPTTGGHFVSQVDAVRMSVTLGPVVQRRDMSAVDAGWARLGDWVGG